MFALKTTGISSRDLAMMSLNCTTSSKPTSCQECLILTKPIGQVAYVYEVSEEKSSQEHEEKSKSARDFKIIFAQDI